VIRSRRARKTATVWGSPSKDSLLTCIAQVVVTDLGEEAICAGCSRCFAWGMGMWRVNSAFSEARLPKSSTPGTPKKGQEESNRGGRRELVVLKEYLSQRPRASFHLAAGPVWTVLAGTRSR
jgi:hypothetical protein